MSVPYTYPRGKTIIFQRAVPSDLQGRYPGKTIKLDLKTSDWALAAKKVAKLVSDLEAEWSALRAAPESSPKALKVHAAALLAEYGLAPGNPENHPVAVDLFLNRLESRLEAYAKGCEDTYDSAAPSEYLPPVEAEALRLLQGKQEPTLSEALELHISSHRKVNNEQFTTYQRRAFATLIAVTGDKAVKALTRDDVRTYIAKSKDGGAATGTIRRRLGAFRAVFTTWAIERDKGFANPFEKHSIPDEGEDRKKRQPFTGEELSALFQACKSKDDDARWLLAMLIDTGARLAELTGLALSDIVLDGPVPYVHIQVHPWRGLKNKKSNREVPLVGASLWAAQRVMESAKRKPGQTMAFPRYTSDQGCNATAASATLVSWIKRKGFAHVLHELRHTMADRLRDVGCPKDVRYAIDGHASQDVGDTYGRGHGLAIKNEWLQKVALKS